MESPATSTRVTAIVPPGTSAGAQDLVIVTASRATSDGRVVEVLADQPQILGIDPPTPTLGQPMTIRGVGFTSALDPATTCSVLLGTTVALTAAPTKLSSGVEELTVPVPATGVDVTADVDVVVKTPRLTSSAPARVRFQAAAPGG